MNASKRSKRCFWLDSRYIASAFNLPPFFKALQAFLSFTTHCFLHFPSSPTHHIPFIEPSTRICSFCSVDRSQPKVSNWTCVLEASLVWYELEFCRLITRTVLMSPVLWAHRWKNKTCMVVSHPNAHVISGSMSIHACTSAQRKPPQSALSPLKLTLMQAAIFYLTRKCGLCAWGW